MQASPSSQAQAKISPADGRLLFPLPSSSAAAATCPCRTVLTITNTSTSGAYLAFKVKTTQPRRYLVRPSQGVLRPGQRQEVSVQIPPERQGEALRALLEEDSAGGGGGGGIGDKFQVLYAGMDEATQRALGAGEQQQEQLQERLGQFWAGLDRRLVLERRLDVEFGRAQQPAASSSSWPVGGSPGSSIPAAFTPTGPMTLAENRKRYDDLVTLTVTLTSERDTLRNALDTLKFELRRELASQGERGQHVAAGGTVKQDQLSLHKRRRSKASSVAFGSSIPGIAAHAREPSRGHALAPTGAGSRHRGPDTRHQQQHQHQHQHQQASDSSRPFSTVAVAAAAVLAFAVGRWL